MHYESFPLNFGRTYEFVKYNCGAVHLSLGKSTVVVFADKKS